MSRSLALLLLGDGARSQFPFLFSLCFSEQGTPLKKDSEDCGSEGRGIAARILGPSKPVS